MTESITSLSNAKVKHLVKLQSDRSSRTRHREIVVEGKKMVAEAPSLKEVFVTRADLAPDGIPMTLVSEEVMKKISSVKTPEGIIAVAPLPPQKPLNGHDKILCLDTVQDPGNLGTLLRTALSFGWTGIYLLNDCCDPYSPKALRAAKGATLRLALFFGDDSHLKELAKTHHTYVADLKGKPLEQTTRKKKQILILGSEGSGVTESARLLGEAVTLPIASEMESLNVAVAGGILMYYL